MQLRISRQHLAQLRLWAEQAGEFECCGLLFGTRNRVERLALAANVAENPARNFEIDPAALIAAEKSSRAGGCRISGYFHSHPTGPARPSARDIAMASADGRIWVIIGEELITAWWPEFGEAGSVEFRPVQICVEG